MAKVNEAKVTKSSKEATLIDTGKVVTETASVLPRMGDQPRGQDGEREVHTISSDEPPKPHEKGVLDAEVSSTMEMAVLSVPKGLEVEGSLDTIPVRTDLWADVVPIFVGNSEEVEEAHWAVLGGFRRLAEQS
jgi:hypothetical protein